MASSGNNMYNYSYSLLTREVAILVLIFVFAFMQLLPQSAGEQSSKSENIGRQKEMVLGSRPPGCVNKCSSCRPCLATLIIPSHQKKDSVKAKPITSSSFDLQNQDDDSYYYLSWKCKCGDKLFHP